MRTPSKDPADTPEPRPRARGRGLPRPIVAADLVIGGLGLAFLLVLTTVAGLQAGGVAPEELLPLVAGRVSEGQVVLALAALACLAGLMVRQAAGRSASGRIVGAVRAWADGERDAEALYCEPAEQPEIAAWNHLVESLSDASRGMSERRREAGEAPPAGERRLGPMCNALPDGLLLVGEDRRIRYANGAAAFLFGRSVDGLMGVSIDEVVESEPVRRAVADAVGGVPRFAPPVDVPRGADGADGVLRHVVRPIRGEVVRDAVILLQDVTQQHVAAASRESFVAHVAHELRTPLTNIMLWAQTATERGNDDPRTTEKALNIITGESRRLERVVQDMLSISEIESGRQSLHVTDLDLLGLVEELRQDYGPQAEEKGLSLAFELPPKLPILSADRDKVGVALHNLIGNAIKYTPAGGRVVVEIGEDEEGGIQVTVQDTGIGIGPEDLGRIFERFQRADDERIAGIAGSGLGLAIARDLARLHGGDIEADSEPGEGSRFTLRLPVRAAA